jgi:hypothetical protein
VPVTENETFETHLAYRPMSVDDDRQERVAELGEFPGNIIAGIYVCPDPTNRGRWIAQ